MIENKKEMILENGIRVISHKHTGLHVADIGLYFRCGSAFENNSNNGITHLVEHLFLDNSMKSLKRNYILKWKV